MHELIEEFIAMNSAGLDLELCEKYYDENVLMLNNGAIFAESKKESYDKQKGFVASVREFNVTLLSSNIKDNISELTFKYKIIGADFKKTNLQESISKHGKMERWKDGKIER